MEIIKKQKSIIDEQQEIKKQIEKIQTIKKLT
jgi:hypothetical protein